jgi:hypothetical protein
LAVATTTSVVITGWATTTHRNRRWLWTTTPQATMIAHPTCNDGIAANWLAIPEPGRVV